MKLFLIAVLLAVTQAAPPVPRKTADNTNSDKASTPPQSANPVTTNPDQGSRQSSKPEDAPKTVRVSELPPVSVGRDWISIGLTGVLVIVGILGVTAAYKTLQKIENQVAEMKNQRVIMDGQLTAMKDQLSAMNEQTNQMEASVSAAQASAKTSNDNLELIINKERGRLSFELPDIAWEGTPIPPFSTIGSVRYKILYFGYTPAFIVRAQMWAFVDTLNEPVTQVISDIPIPTIVSMGTELPLIKTLIWPIIPEPGKTETDIREKRAFIHFHGRIQYDDVFGRRREATIKRRWEESGIPWLNGRWVTYGRPEDNHNT
jgi:hypothetical protein